jgi:hypothetical protein
VFVCLTSENWNSVMYVFIKQSGIGASIYFVSLIVFGHYMLLNLFLAILLKYLSESVIEEEEEDEDEEDGEPVVPAITDKKEEEKPGSEVSASNNPVEISKPEDEEDKKIGQVVRKPSE